MICAHCNVGVREKFAPVDPVFVYGSMRHRDGHEVHFQSWRLHHMQCPERGEPIVLLERSQPRFRRVSVMAYPLNSTRPIPTEVPDPYATDFREACGILDTSPEASAA